MVTGMSWAERALVFSTFLTLLLMTYGDTVVSKLTIEEFDKENRALELEFLKLRREALNDDSVPWHERVEAWTEKNRDRFAVLSAAQEEFGLSEAEELVSEMEPSEISDPLERAMVEAHQRLGDALKRDMAEEFQEGDDYRAWVEAWSKESQSLVEQAEATASTYAKEQSERIEPIVIEQIDDSDEAVAMADAQERMAEKILELRVAHAEFEDFRSALDQHSAFLEGQVAIIEAARITLEARQLDSRIEDLENNP